MSGRLLFWKTYWHGNCDDPYGNISIDQPQLIDASKSLPYDSLWQSGPMAKA